MNINNEEQTLAVLETIKNLSPAAQQREIVKITRKLELNQMYYEQKGQEKAVLRVERCIRILASHLDTLPFDK